MVPDAIRNIRLLLILYYDTCTFCSVVHVTYVIGHNENLKQHVEHFWYFINAFST